MKHYLFVICIFFITGCQHSTDMWEETKTAARYLNRKGKSLFSKDLDSKSVQSAAEFYGPQTEEFIALQDNDLNTQYIDYTAPQPKDDPGAVGSKVPGIDKFRDPSNKLASIFKNLHFNTDEHILSQKDQLQLVQSIADYLKQHPNVYVFVAGHCDDRASESYNLTLGAKRANYIRGLLIKAGVNPNQLYTISYGKERPLVHGITSSARAKNRRVEFKIYDQQSGSIR
ncbi:MAG: OmpA family protein [Chlamydiales bacterium]|nr:OmpA family protein [Chlamydiales bacterium]